MKMLLAVATLFCACGSASSYYSACGNDADCTKGQICPISGPMQGRCTKACTKDEECAGLSSGHLVCTSDVCTPAP